MYIIYAVNKIGCQPYKKEFWGCFVGPAKSQHNLRFLLSWLFFPICCLFSVKFYLFSLKKDNSSNNNHNSRVLLLMATCNFIKNKPGTVATCRLSRQFQGSPLLLELFTHYFARPSMRLPDCRPITDMCTHVHCSVDVVSVVFSVLVYFDGIVHFLGNVDLVFVYILQFQLLLFFLYISFMVTTKGGEALGLPSILEQQFTLLFDKHRSVVM